MEKLRHSDGSLDRVCVFCPARIPAGTEDYCDPSLLNDKNIRMKVGRCKPDNCPRNVRLENRSEPAEIILRRMLGR